MNECTREMEKIYEKKLNFIVMYEKAKYSTHFGIEA